MNAGIDRYDRELQPPAKLDFVFFDAGGGHRAAASALEAAISSTDYGWDVRLVNLQEVLDSLDIFRKLTGVRLQDLYNFMLARGWTLGASSWLPVVQWVLRRHHKPAVRLLAPFWQERQPDMVVSLVPNLNRSLFDGARLAVPDIPFVTVMTDLADYPPHFWMEQQDQYLICGTTRAYIQARQQGFDAAHVRQVSGMVLRPLFYNDSVVDRRAECERLGLDPGLPTALVMFGGEGSNVMLAVARRLGDSSIPLQLIMMCGRNAKLRERLNRMKMRNRMVTFGFVKDVPRYMSVADFFIGKPGPGSISDALHMGLPVVVESNSWTLPQERFNTDWIRQQGYGIVLRNLIDVEDAVQELITGGSLAQIRQRILGFENRALYEIPPILQEILTEHRLHGAPLPHYLPPEFSGTGELTTEPES